MTVEHAHEVWTHNWWTVLAIKRQFEAVMGQQPRDGDPPLRHPCRSNICDTGRVLDDQWKPTDDI